MAELTGNPGFSPSKPEQMSTRHSAAIELIATVALTVSLVVAATAVSVGKKSLARTDLVARPSAQLPVERQ